MGVSAAGAESNPVAAPAISEHSAAEPEEAVPPEGTPTHVEAEAAGDRVHAFTFQSMAERGRWAEEIMSQVCIPEVQQDFLSHGSATFFREAFASTFWTVNSLATLKLWFVQAGVAMDAARSELGGVRARAEEVERELEEARVAEEKAKEAFEEASRQTALEAENVQAAEKRLREAEAEIRSQQQKLHDVTSRAQEADKKAAEAEARAVEAEGKAAAAEDKVTEAEARAAEAVAKAAESEAKVAESEEKVAEAEMKAAEAEAKVAETEKGATEAVATFRKSPAYKLELADATAYAYNLGFKDCKLKVKQVFGLEGVEDMEPDSLEGAPPSTPNEPSAM